MTSDRLKNSSAGLLIKCVITKLNFAKFLRKSKRKKTGSTKTSKSDANDDDKSTTENEIEVNGQEVEQASGFDRGLEAEKILGATEVDNEIHFLVKWYGTTHKRFDKFSHIQYLYYFRNF